jgi:alpha-mannosidase
MYEKKKGKFEFQKFEWIEKGPVRAVVRVSSKYKESIFIQDFEIIADREDVRCNAELDWREKYAVAKLILGTGKKIIEVNSCRVASRETVELSGVELPNGTLLNVRSEDDQCFMVSCPEKGAYNVTDGSLGVTVARSSIYAWYRAEVPEAAGYYEHLDMGSQKFAYSVSFAENSFDMNGIQRCIENAISPSILLTHKSEGELGKKCSILNIDKSGLVLLSSAKSEEKEGVIFRFWHLLEKAENYKISFYDGQDISISAGPEEIIDVIRKSDGNLVDERDGL